MKIENIIEDIIKDITDIKMRLEQKIRNENPQLDFSLNLPEVEKLSAIKIIELSVNDEQGAYTLRLEVHTHNGNRVFEHMPPLVMSDGSVVVPPHHPMQDWYIHTLRETIKRRKLKCR